MSVGRCHLLDLPWEDVLVTHIFCYLPLRQLVRLQRVSKQFYALIQVYLANCRTFDLTQVGHTKSIQFIPGFPYSFLYLNAHALFSLIPSLRSHSCNVHR